MAELENLGTSPLREIRQEIGMKKDRSQLRREIKTCIAEVNTIIKSLGNDMSADAMNLEKHLEHRINNLNRSVVQYHSSTVGHGVLYSELETRMQRVEQHLKLPPYEPH